MAKKRPKRPGTPKRGTKRPTKPLTTKETKVILHTKDCQWWGNLDCTDPEQDLSWHERNGWVVEEDDPVNNAQHPNIDRRVKLVKEELLDKDGGPLPMVF